MAYSMLTVFVNGHCNLMLLANGYIYAYLLQQPLLKEYFLQVGNRHLANATDSNLEREVLLRKNKEYL